MNRSDAEEYTQALGQIGGGLWRQILWAAKQGVPQALNLSLRQWVDDRLGGYVKMAVDERREVVKELAPDLSQQEIADVLGVTQPTISGDLAAINIYNEDAEAERPDDRLPINIYDLAEPADDRAERIQELAAQRQPEPVAEPSTFPAGPFSCVVIDPPWPIKKIVTRARPWQGVELDYPTMTLEEIAALPVDKLAADNAHLYLWVTHRFLPAGLDLIARWGFRYQCLMTWNKGTGVVPFSWMYDTEHVLFASRGSLKLAKRGLRLSFDEPPVRDGHSTKPEVFYDRVRSASPEPRLEMFARQARGGFDGWGNEVDG